MERINKQPVFNYYNKKNKWLGIMDYKSLFFFVIYILVIFKILNLINIGMIIKLYLFVILVLPLLIFAILNLQEDSMIDKLQIILIFAISRNIYVNRSNTAFLKGKYIKM